MKLFVLFFLGACCGISARWCYAFPLMRHFRLARPAVRNRAVVRQLPFTSYDLRNHPNWRLINDSVCGLSVTDRIVGGRKAHLGQYPWMARLGYLGKNSDVVFRCGGALISKLYVISAAHCVVNLPQGITLTTLRLGEYDAGADIDCIGSVCAKPVQDFRPVKITIHPMQNLPRFRHDISLIRLDREAVLSPWVVPICVPYGHVAQKNFVGELADVAGWGIYNTTAKLSSNVLLTLKVPVRPLDLCVKAFARKAELSTSQLCAGGITGEDSCGGDSGGPLMKLESLGGLPRYFIVGVVSFGVKDCGKGSNPAVYTRVGSYVEWILNNVEP